MVRTASRQRTILTEVIIGKKVASSLEAAPVVGTSTPISAVPLNQLSKQPRRKKACPEKEADFLGTSCEEPLKEVLRFCLLKL